MTAKHRKVLKASIAALTSLLLVVVLMGLIVVNAQAAEGESQPPAATASGVEITGYRLSHFNDPKYTGKITKDMPITIILDVYDTRLPHIVKDYRPSGWVNSGSFGTTNNTKVVASTAASVTDAPPYGKFYTITCYNLYYKGTGNTFQFDLFYENEPTIAMTPLTLTINECEEYVSSSDSSSSSSTSVETKGTGFVLKEASYGQDTIYAGQSFPLTATFLATNGTYAVENVSISVTPPKELSLAGGNSMVYFGTAKPNQAVPVTFNLIPNADIEEGSYAIVLDVSGIDSKSGSEVKATVTISVPVIQPERFEIFNVQLPTDLTMGMDDGMGYGSVTLVNQGKGKVANVSVDVVGAGITTEDGKQYVGHIAGGEQKSADFNLMAAEAGQIDAQVLVTYENARGEQKTLTHDFTISVMDMGGGEWDGGMDPMPIDPMPEEKSGLPVWGWALIVLAVLGGVIGLILVLKKRKAKKAAAALEDDYDDEA